MDKVDSLVVQLQAKNIDAFEKLYEMYFKNICGAINIIVNNEAVANELCQDVFLKVWEKSDMYNASRGRFFTWLLNMARNKAIDYTRSKQHRIEKKNHSLDVFVDIYKRPDEEKPTENEYEGLKKMLGQLKEKCVELIKVLYFQGCTQVDASQLLAIPLGTVKSRNRNCLKELRKNLKDD